MIMELAQRLPYIPAATVSGEGTVTSIETTTVFPSVRSYFSDPIVLLPYTPVASRSVFMDRTVVLLLVLAVVFLLLDVASRRFVVEGTIIAVLLIGALGLKLTDSIARREIY